MTNDIERAKAVLAGNATAPFGIFGVVAASRRFPPRELLNKFLMGGSDPCDQDQRMTQWPPFMLSVDEFAAVEAWWQGVHPGSVTDRVVTESWHDWTAELIESIDVNEDVRRIEAIGRRIAEELQHGFSHPEQAARRLFAEFHHATSGTRGWSDADYYDHEGALGIALEVEFHRLFGRPRDSGSEFLDWRRATFAAWKSAGIR